jgi:hypothetical protein
MSEPVSPELKQNRMKEFMTLLPLTIELAGLAKAQPGTLFNEGQMEARVTSIRNAFKMARQLVKDVGENGI